MIFYGSSNQSHLLIAFNRFCAIFFRHYYTLIFTKRSTVFLAYSTLMFSTVISVVCYEFLGCQFVFVPDFWTFDFVSTEFCESVTWYSDFVFNLCLVASTINVNLITALKAAKESRKVGTGH